MKILAIEKEVSGVQDHDYKPFLKAEALRALELYQAGIIREIYFRLDEHQAVIMLECQDEAEAREVLSTLPLVQEGLIDFEVIPLGPYTGFSRLLVSEE